MRSISCSKISSVDVYKFLVRSAAKQEKTGANPEFFWEIKFQLRSNFPEQLIYIAPDWSIRVRQAFSDKDDSEAIWFWARVQLLRQTCSATAAFGQVSKVGRLRKPGAVAKEGVYRDTDIDIQAVFKWIIERNLF